MRAIRHAGLPVVVLQNHDVGAAGGRRVGRLRLAAEERRRGAAQAAHERPGGVGAHRHVAGADAGLVPEPLDHLLIDGQIDDDGVARSRGPADRHRGANQELRLVCGIGWAHRERADEFAAVHDPGRQRRGRLHVTPRSGHHRGHGRRAGIGRLDRHERQRQLRIACLHIGAPPREDPARVLHARAARDLDRGGLRHDAHFVHEIVVAVLEQIGRDVHEHHDAAEEEEDEDQPGRDDAHEDVRDDQLAPDAPQQPAVREPEQPYGEDRQRQEDPERRHRGEEIRELGKRDEAADEREQQPDGRGCEEEPAGKRAKEKRTRARLRLGCGVRSSAEH